jgi:CRISPR/Cas system-associated exonuclease Cas4 (RecB family)
VAQVEDGWMPKWFELTFGIGSPPITLPDGTHIRGAIDLIEEKTGALRITDHKTGRAQPPFGFTGKGEILQPLIYAEAAQTLLGKPAELTRLYYCTQRGGYMINEIAVTDVARNSLSEVIDAIEHSILKGFLPAAPRKDACTYCDYKIVCGPYEEMRLLNKREDRLQLLEQIRT